MSTSRATAPKSTRTTTSGGSGGFTAEERAAMRERAREAKAAGDKAAEERAALDAIAALSGSDRSMAERLHAFILATAPELAPKTWYGMPAYAKDGKIICFFQPASKFKARYATLGFNEDAKLDAGAMWPTSFALLQLTPAEEKKIATLLKKAVR